MKKDINGQQVVREALRITTLVQMGAYILMYQLGQLPENKAVNILLSLALWAICTLDLWFVILLPDPIDSCADKENAEKDRKSGLVLCVLGTIGIFAVFVMQIISGSIIPFA